MTPDLALALAFVNTVAPPGGGPDLWTAPADVGAWLVDTGLAPDPASVTRLPPPALRVLMDDALRLRRALTELVEGWAGGVPLPSGLGLLELNRFLGTRPRRTLCLEVSPHGYGIRDRVEIASVSELLAPVAETGALLLAREDPGRVRRCAASGCVHWFLDTSRNQQRRWCSMAVCGNRAKQAAHQARRRRPRH